MKITGPKLKCQIIDGKYLAEQINLETYKTINSNKIEPGLAVILVGNDPASELYVSLKQRACLNANINFHLYKFDESSSEKEIIEVIKFLNADEETNAILVQLPLPEKFDANKIILSIDQNKDVDGFHPKNIEKIKLGKPTILSPLVLGVDRLIQETKTELNNKIITIFANHEIFAEPFKFLYEKNNKIIFTSLNDHQAQEKCHEADILIVAIGKPKFVNNKFIKDNAIVIDIGINEISGETVGDVDANNVILKASFITPVPGGVGPMTIAYLLKNTLQLFNKQTQTKK
ncbi:hypothetical protein A2223_00775 [Candidatus Falkowbacteria bacterium RIFOXYA2_FULL_35_8]|uniref:Bifunctional protein FolD n=1 Tax=Candidatus Falkowbacteria bacterium RIFOXYC2_FULL_36_12 TaxID=1798002 RepID=A0A1F5SZY5_9BACT|nr:MAG: hypothetical protein A2300_00945 [Candidatus Falkowbacteria bacterium RIFOXYB2_FULL_35_7]OGF32267.1 MAG: hypothetical protein A2478_02995 [Candidatus Falkowbacteria bacterium RIFOXYC2_FULL_36_12]OGF33842.1 MAG: hypothetical protein A2223_00775 [Candidatus Falkowbacteria bacterium RIFOXYA2_FULL_35_8]